MTATLIIRYNSQMHVYDLSSLKQSKRETAISLLKKNKLGWIIVETVGSPPNHTSITKEEYEFIEIKSPRDLSMFFRSLIDSLSEES